MISLQEDVAGRKTATLFLIQYKKCNQVVKSAVDCLEWPSHAVIASTNKPGCISVFQGASSLSLDAKGRLCMPIGHQHTLTTIVPGPRTRTAHPSGHVTLFLRPAPQGLRARTARMPVCALGWERILGGAATHMHSNASRPVRVSPELRPAAGLSHETLLPAMVRPLGLWHKTTYDAQEAKAMQGAMPDVCKDFSF